MSLSCHKATFSKKGIIELRIYLATPVRFSLSTGFLLCGIAEDPFWFLSKNSSTSKISVLCKFLISIATLSIDEAIILNIEKKYACLSLGIICVDISSHLKFNLEATYFSTLGSIEL